MRSAFFRQMALISALILLTLVLMGSAYRLTMQSYLEAEKRETLSSNAEAIAMLTRAYVSAGDLEDSWNFRMSVSLASEVSGAETVICDETGMVLVCSCEQVSCEHLGKTVDESFVDGVLTDGERSVTGTLPGLYDETRYIQAVRLISDTTGDALGVVIVSTPVTDVTESTGGMFRIFLYTAAAVMLVAVGASFLVSRQEIRPMRQLARTVRRFGHGDLSVRAKQDDNLSLEMADLTAAFNNMADTLQQSEQRRQEFIANVSHELKTPMTVIAGYMDGMLDGTIPPEQHRRYMQTVAEEVRRLSRLVRSMLQISRIQAEGLDEAQKSRFDLSAAVTQTLFSFEQKIEQRHLEVDVQLPEKPLYTVAQQDAITQVIYNLTDNAVKFCNDCGYLTVLVRQEGDKALVSIRNTGPTIPPEELPRIFERFHKLDKSRSLDRSGVGLGLYLVKTIIGAHGEDIWVESRDGATTFTFTLPAVK